MTDCPFTLNANGLWQCPDCGWVFKLKRDKPPRRNCPASRTPEAIAEAKEQKAEAVEAGKKLGWTAADVKKWTAALLRWRAAGYPKRTGAEVGAILLICEDCDQYAIAEHRCKICRCGVSTAGLAVFNKARLATERCPENKW